MKEEENIASYLLHVDEIVNAIGGLVVQISKELLIQKVLRCNTPVLIPCIKIVHDVITVIKSWRGAQGQGPAIDLVFCV